MTRTWLARVLAIAMLTVTACTASPEVGPEPQAPDAAPTPLPDDPAEDDTVDTSEDPVEEPDEAQDEPASEEPDDVPVIPAASAAPTVEVVAISEGPEGYATDSQRVVVTTEDEVGDRITAEVDVVIDALFARVSEAHADWATTQDYPEPEGIVQARVTRADTSVVSVVVDSYLYFGGAHGVGDWNVMVFATATGELLELADVGISGEARDGLAAMLDAAADEQTPENGLSLHAGSPVLDRWSLTQDAFLVHVDHYEGGAGFLGHWSIEVPLPEVTALGLTLPGT